MSSPHPPRPAGPPPGRPPPGWRPRPDVTDPRAYVVRYRVGYLALLCAMGIAGLAIASRIFAHEGFEFASLSGVIMVALTAATAGLCVWSAYFLVTRRPAIVMDAAGVHLAGRLRRRRFIPWTRISGIAAPLRHQEWQTNDTGGSMVLQVDYLEIDHYPEAPGPSIRLSVRQALWKLDRPRLRAAVRAFAPHVVWQGRDW